MTQATDLQINPATPSDIPLLLGLIRALAEFENLSDQVVATEALLAQALFGEPPAASALIARVAGEAAGFALYFSNFSTFLARPGIYLEDLFVLPAYRSRGIGRSLLVRLAKIAQTGGYGRLEWAVLDWNRRARDFYESLGAVPLKDWIIHRITGDGLRELAESDPPRTGFDTKNS